MSDGLAEQADGDAAEQPVTRVTRKKDLIDAVAAASGVKKQTVKPVVEAVLTELAAALQRGDALVLPPLGKLSVNKTKGPAGGVMVLRLRRPRDGEAESAPATEAGDGEA